MIFNATGGTGGGTGSIALDSITLTGQPSRTDYKVGEPFSRDGLAVQANYTNGATKAVEDYTISPSGPLPFGTDHVTVSYMEDGVTATQRINITVTRTEIAIPVQRDSLTYTGEPQHPEWENYDPEKMDASGLQDETDAGSYQVTFTPHEEYSWPGEDHEPKVVTWTIARKPVPVPTLTSSLTYTGEPQAPTWKDYDQTAMSMEGGEAQVDADTYTATFTLDDNHEWSTGGHEPKAIEWTIAKAECELAAAPDRVTLSPDLTSAKVTITRKGDGAISAQSMAPDIVDVETADNIITITSKDQKSGKADVTVTVQPTKNYNGGTLVIPVQAAFVQIFGAMWHYGDPSTAWTRLTTSNDPYHYVNIDVVGTPSPAIGTGPGSSPFDEYMPWMGMERYNVSNDGQLTKEGEPGYALTNDTMVWVPKFYYAVKDDPSGKKRYIYVATAEAEGFSLFPGTGRFFGRYDTSNGARSITGAMPQVNTDRATFRAQARAKGAGWLLLDMMTYSAVIYLIMVEFADWHTQKVVAYGYADGNSAAIPAGETDSMTYHTGTAGTSLTDGKHAMQYRNIEHVWGNVRQIVDGIVIDNRAVWICTNPDQYGDTTANHTASGVALPSSGWITGLGLSDVFPWAIIPNAASGGSAETYVTDYVYSSTGTRVLDVGGSWIGGTYAGPLYFDGNGTPTSTSSYLGARLLYDPEGGPGAAAPRR